MNKQITRLDPKHFPAFVALAECGNFSVAGDKVAMTQSNVSMHIKKLEEQVGATLFKRTAKQTLLTDAGKTLLVHVKRYFDSMSELLVDVNSAENDVEGMVTYAMPPSCILSPHFPMLLQRRLDYPGIHLRVNLIPNDQVFKMILEGMADFGFVTEKIENPLLDYENFCQEEYILVSSSKRELENLNTENLLSYQFINYPGMNVYFDYWIKYVMPDIKHVKPGSLRYAGEINTIDGGIKMVKGGLGVSIFPRHCVENALASGELFEYQNSNLEPLLNDIFIVHLKEPEPSRRVRMIIDWFLDMHPEFQNTSN